MDRFLNHAGALVEQSIKAYLDRGFENLMVSFGCTGGQHRSVYCAEERAKYLEDRYNVTLVVRHIEQEQGTRNREQ